MSLHDPKRRYNFADEGLPGDGSAFGYLRRTVIPGTAQAHAAQQRGDGTTVVFLPYPDFDAADYKTAGKVLPDRQSESANDFSPWLFYSRDKGVLRFGKIPFSVFFDNPDDAGFNVDEDHPIYLVYNAIYAAVSKGVVVETPVGNSVSDEWAVILNGAEGGPNEKKRFEVVKRPDYLYAAYAFVCRSGEKPQDNYIASGAPLGAASGDLPVAFIMAKSVVRELASALNKPLRNDDPNAGFLHPQVTGCKFVHFFDKKVGTCEAMRGAAAATRPVSGGLGGQRRGPVASAGARDGEGVGYGVYISDTYNGRPDGITYSRKDVADFACQTLRPWREVIAGYAPDACADLVERCGLPPSILYHAWKSRPEFQSETLKGIFNARVISLPGQTGPGGPAAPAGRVSAVPMHGGGGQSAATPPAQPAADPSAGTPPTDTPLDEAPFGGRISDPPSTPGVASPQAAAVVRNQFRELLAAQAAAAVLTPHPVPPATTPAPRFQSGAGGSADKPADTTS